MTKKCHMLEISLGINVGQTKKTKKSFKGTLLALYSIKQQYVLLAKSKNATDFTKIG